MLSYYSINKYQRHKKRENFIIWKYLRLHGNMRQTILSLPDFRRKSYELEKNRKKYFYSFTIDIAEDPTAVFKAFFMEMQNASAVCLSKYCKAKKSVEI